GGGRIPSGQALWALDRPEACPSTGTGAANAVWPLARAGLRRVAAQYGLPALGCHKPHDNQVVAFGPFRGSFQRGNLPLPLLVTVHEDQMALARIQRSLLLQDLQAA